MSKKEKIFPIDTVGGRIQSLRRKAKLSRVELYDKVYPDHDKCFEESKYKTVYNWESNGTGLNYENVIAICKAFNCSSDYLLGLNECTNKTNQFIHDQTGLSERAIKRLQNLEHEKFCILPLNFFLDSEDFVDMLKDFYFLRRNQSISEYASLMLNEKESEIFKNIWRDYRMRVNTYTNDINACLNSLLDRVKISAVEKAQHDFNSPSGSKAFDNALRAYNSKKND